MSIISDSMRNGGVILKRVEPGVFDVMFDSLNLGTIRREDEGFWSDYGWTIDGVRPVKRSGGVGGKTVKFAGFHSSKSAAFYLATMKSGEIMAFVNGKG